MIVAERSGTAIVAPAKRTLVSVFRDVNSTIERRSATTNRGRRFSRRVVLPASIVNIDFVSRGVARVRNGRFFGRFCRASARQKNDAVLRRV